MGPVEEEKPPRVFQRKGKLKAVDDPRSVAPHSLTAETFQLKHPFIDVYQSMSHMRDQEDRCAETYQMPCETMSGFMEFLSVSVEDGDAFLSDGGEQSSKPKQFVTLTKLVRLSRALAEKKRRSRMLHEEQVECKGEADIENVALEVKEDEHEIVSDEERPSNGSHEDAFLNSELPFKSPSSKGFSDVVAKAFDSEYVKQGPQDDLSKLITSMVFELKGDDTIKKGLRGGPRGIYQAADCAVEQAFQNLALGRHRPIWLFVWSEHFWTYGCLVLDRAVRISKEGKLLADDDDLWQRLASANAKLQEYMEDTDASYEAQNYLVAKLFVSSEVLVAPTGEHLNQSAWRFYESLLRLFLGDRVLSWNKKDVEALIAKVREIDLRWHHSIMDGVTDELLDRWSSSKRLRAK